MAEKLGMQCKLYYDATPLADGPSGASWTELTKAREVTVNLEASEADITSRGNSGWRATRAALRDASLEFELVWDPADTAVEAIRDAYLNGSEIALAAMDGDIATVGSEGFVANFYITAFNRGEPLEEAVTVSVTAKPSSKQQWYEVAA